MVWPKLDQPRLARVLKHPGGNAMLIGVVDSGRQSLKRLATTMADFEIFNQTNF